MEPYYKDDFVTLYNADCREVLGQLEPVDLVLTDPPYGIDFVSGRSGQQGKSRIVNDQDVSLRDEVLLQARYRGAFVFGSPRIEKPKGWKVCLIWHKGDHVGMGNLTLPWKPNFEEIYVLGEGFKGQRTSSVVHFLAIAGTVSSVKGRIGRMHPTEKPLDLLRYLIGKTDAVTILDPFAGSGTTLVAAKQLGLKAIGVEIEEKYCRIAVERLRQNSLIPLMEAA